MVMKKNFPVRAEYVFHVIWIEVGMGHVRNN
jgi:hypothetical protein